MVCFLSKYILSLLLTFKIEVLNNQKAFSDKEFSSQITRFKKKTPLNQSKAWPEVQCCWRVDDPPLRIKIQVTRRQHDSLIRVFYLCDWHRTARATERHLLDHIIASYGQDDINPRVKHSSASEFCRTKQMK